MGDYLLDSPEEWGQAEIVMLSAFGDESHDETNQRVFAVAGLLGSKDEWEEFRSKWKARLGNRVFHAADCESGYGDFRDMPELDRLQLHRDLTQLLANSALMGYGQAIDLAGCYRVIPSVLKDFPDMPYYDCFLRAIKYLSDLAGAYVPRDRTQFTFDQHRTTQYNAGLLYDWLSQYRDNIVETIAFGTRKEPGIQAADLWAREVMKRCDSHLFDLRSTPRTQWSTLMGTKRFKFKFMRVPDLLSELKAAEQYTVSQSDYETWRVKHKLLDNLSNRFRWFAMQDNARNDDEQS